MSFPQWQTGQASPEVPVNEAFDILKFLAVFGRDPQTTSGLTWGYLGGPWGSLTITEGTVSLTASSTNYIVANRTTGVVSVSTSTTNWNDVSTYARLYTATTNSVTVTSYVDYRGGTNGALGPRAVVVSGLPTGTEGDLLRYNDVSDQWEAADLETVLPTATTDQVLQFNGTNWVAATSGGGITAIPIAVGDETTELTTGTNKISFRMPYNMTLTKVKGSLRSEAEGTLVTVDVKKNGTSIFSTLLTFDDLEQTTETATTPAVLSTTTLDDDDVITIDVTQVGDVYGGQGLKVYLVGTAS